MELVDTRAIEIVLERIPNGIIFEAFAKEFVVAVTNNVEFVPIGGTRDGGIDGLEYAWTEKRPNRLNKTIYQFSKEEDGTAKIKKTLVRLQTTVPDCNRLMYYTNRVVRDQHVLLEEAWDEHQVHLSIYDQQWFATNVNSNPKTINVFRKMEEQHFHAYERSNTMVSQFDERDSRIYIYLRQQIENRERDYGSGDSTHLDELLMDSLILLALEGTDSSKDILRSPEDIRNRIMELTDFKVEWVDELLPTRLEILSTKPRRIKHHRSEDKYCLPYETRLEITERNLADEALLTHFKESAAKILSDNLKAYGITIRAIEPIELVMKIIHKLFHQQGLEFAQFVMNGNRDVFTDRLLNEVIAEEISNTGIVPKNREEVHGIILDCFREIIYSGDEDQKEFLLRLSNTYNMLFLLQIEPTLVRYFERIAGQLRIYVDSSILIPAIAEYNLKPQNQRYTNLLRNARDAGIKIIVNDFVLSEIESHFRTTKYNFHKDYERREHLFNDTMMIAFIDEILIRAYFYSKIEGKIDSFKDYIEQFVSWRMSGDVRGELVLWLEDQFGVMYEEKTIDLDSYEVEQLTKAIKPLKKDSNDNRARTDAKQLLTIHAIRKENNETSSTGIFGYNTWWLTSDVTSQRAFKKIKDSTMDNVTPYIRADYLYNYISLAPSKSHVDGIYKKMFPTLLGVNVSFHVPREVSSYIREMLDDYDEVVTTPRFRSKMRELLHHLKSSPDHLDRHTIQNFYDQLKKEAESYVPPAT